MKKPIVSLFGALGLGIAVQASTASAFNCLTTALPTTVGQSVSVNCNHAGVANGSGTATFTSSQATTNKWTYTFQYFAGPVFPTSSSSLVNADGVTKTQIATGGRCSPAVDGIGGGGNTANCTTKKPPDAGAPRFLMVTVP